MGESHSLCRLCLIRDGSRVLLNQFNPGDLVMTKRLHTVMRPGGGAIYEVMEMTAEKAVLRAAEIEFHWRPEHFDAYTPVIFLVATGRVTRPSMATAKGRRRYEVYVENEPKFTVAEETHGTN